PAIADQNVSYYRKLVSGPAYWQDLSAADVELPTFGDVPSGMSLAPRATPIPDPAGAPTYRRTPQPRPEQRPKGPIMGEPAPSSNVQAQGPAPLEGPMALAYKSDQRGQ
ncbi:MAG: hypothetical protein AAF986_10840, partial [Pseudomonadota bacterium]